LKARLAVVRIASLLAPIFVTALAAADPIVAHVPVPGSPHLRAVRTTTPPVIDGTIDDDVWRLAEASSHFTQRVPNDGAEPSDPTTVRVLYDDDAVYVAFDCPQSHSALTPHLTRRDRFVEVDSVQFDLGTRGDHTSAFEFYVSASGTLADSIRFNDTDFSSDWDENWEARTHIGETGWTAEFRIPLRILRFPTRAVQSWDFQANRYISSRQESDNWAYVPRSTAGEVSHYGRLDDLRGLEERTPIEFRPFVVGELRRRDATTSQLASGTDFLASAGLDLKWHPTQALTLDATFNPDFAQVEADQVVLNLTTFETYYPEKRPFFLEGIDAFATPFQLLYTRRVGRAAPIPSLRLDAVNNEQLVDVPTPATIYGATKLTGRLGDKWSVGTIQAVTAQNDVQVQLGSGARVTRSIDPTSTFNVMRLKRDLGDNASIAVMMTATTHAEQTSNYPLVLPGQGQGFPTSKSVLCPGPVELTQVVTLPLQVPPLGRCFNDAYVGAVDWRWRSPTGDWVTGGQVASSVLERGPARQVADGTILKPGDPGFGLKAYVNKEGGKHWIGSTSVDLESTKFEINDLGYNQRANQLSAGEDVEYRALEPSGPFLEGHVSEFFGETYDARGLLIGQGLYLSSWGRFKNFWNFYTDIHYRGTKFDDREVGDGSALQRDGRFGHELYVGTDSTKRVSLGVDQVTDVIYDGLNLQGNADLNLRVLPQFDFDVLPTWQWTYGEPRFAEDGAVNGQFLFGKLDAKSVGITLRTTYTFAPRLTLQGYAQLFLASGHYTAFTQYQSDPNGQRPVIHVSELAPYGGQLAYNPDFEQGVLNVNVVLRWEYTLGSTLFLVYTRSQVPTTTLDPTDVGNLNLGAVGKAPAADIVLAKLTWWWGG
jgi:hypothetical protein